MAWLISSPPPSVAHLPRQPLQLLNAGIEPVLQYHAYPIRSRQCQKRLPFLPGSGDGLFRHHGLSCGKRIADHLVMEIVRGANVHTVDLGIRKHGVKVLVFQSAILFPAQPAPFGIRIAHRIQAGFLRLLQCQCMNGADGTVSDDSSFLHCRIILS